jgi:hypothetical protein
MALGRLTVGLGSRRASERSERLFHFGFCALLRQPAFKSKEAASVLCQPLEKRRSREEPILSPLTPKPRLDDGHTIDQSVRSLASTNLRLVAQNANETAPFSAERES